MADLYANLDEYEPTQATEEDEEDESEGEQQPVIAFGKIMPSRMFYPPEEEKEEPEEEPIETPKKYGDQILMGHFVSGKFLSLMALAENRNEQSEDVEESGLLDVAGAQLRQTNTVYLAYKAHQIGRLRSNEMAELLRDPEFNLQQELKDNDIPNEDHAFFKDAVNYDEFNNALEYYYQDKEDQETLNNAGFATSLAMGLVVGAVDPVNWIPVARALKFGSAAVKIATEGAIVGALGYEVRNWVNAENFDAKELALETAAGGICSLVLYGGVKGAKRLVDSETFQEFKREMKENFTLGVNRWFTLDEKGELVQATESPDGLVVSKVKRVIWEMVNATPQLQMQNSGNPLLQRLGEYVFRDRVSTKSYNGITVEENLRLYDIDKFDAGEQIFKIRDQWLKENPAGTKEQFDGLVFAVIRDENMAVLNDKTSLIGKAAKKHIEFIDKYQKQVQEVGTLSESFGEDSVKARDPLVLDEDLVQLSKKDIRARGKEFRRKVRENPEQFKDYKESTAQGHVTREYNVEEIKNRPEEFGEIIDKSILLNDPYKSYDEVANVRNLIIADLTGHNPKPQSLDVNFRPKITERVVAVTDKLLYERGFLKFDAAVINDGSLRSLYVQSQLDKFALSEGYKGWQALKDSQTDTAKVAIGKVFSKLGEDQATQLESTHNYNLQLLNDVESLLKGTFRSTDFLRNHRVINSILHWKGVQFACMAGKMALSCIPDAAMIILRTGLGRACKKLPGIRQLFFRESNLSKEDKAQLTKFLGFLDRAIQNNAMTDLGYAPYDKFSEKVAQMTSKWTGMDYITKSYKQTTAEEIFHQIINDCVHEPRSAFLRKMGLNERDIGIIKNEFLKNGSKYKDINYFDLNLMEDNYENLVVKDKLRASITSLVDQTILTPGTGDVPRFLRTGVGSALFMFHTYPFLVWNHLFVPLMRGDISKNRFAQAAFASLALSIFRKEVADFCDNKETDRTSVEYWKEVVDYSLLSNYFVDAAFTGARLFTSRNPLRDISPTIAWFDNTFRLVSDVINPYKTVNPLRILNMVPVTNYWYVRPFTSRIFDGGR